MRIALVVPGGVDRSGEHRVIPVVLALIQRLARHHEVHVFALAQEPIPANWWLCGAEIHNIGGRFTRARAVAAILRINARKRFDVLHAIWSASCGGVAVLAARLIGAPSVVHIAGGELLALPDIQYGGRLRWRGRLREALVLRLASAITAASASMLHSLTALGHTAQRVPLGVDLTVWPPREPVARRAGEPARLIHVASLNRVKDQPTLLRALAMLLASGVEFRLDVVGEDTLHGAIQSLAEELGLASRIHFHGFLPQQTLRPIMEAAHLNIIASRHEAGPVVLLEAAVVGVPTVGTAVGHIAEWAPTASRAVAVGNPAALAAVIGTLLQDEGLRLQVAREAYRRGTSEDADYTAAQFLRLYRALMS
jgi:glycosyltransferase involved in cell wall biosynthesis